MERDKLVEKHAAQAGVSGLKASWRRSQQRCPALGQRSYYHQRRHQYAAVVEQDQRRCQSHHRRKWSAFYGKLVSRNPSIKTIKDYASVDPGHHARHALQKAYDDDKASEKLVPNQVQMGHPDALTPLLNPEHEVTSHFASSPF